MWEISKQLCCEIRNLSDPLSELDYSFSPYTFVDDNPILFNDPIGLTSDSTHPQELPEVIISACPKCGTATTSPPAANVQANGSLDASGLAITSESLGGASELFEITVEAGPALPAIVVGTVIIAPGLILEHFHPTPGINYNALPRGINGGGDIPSYYPFPHSGPVPGPIVSNPSIPQFPYLTNEPVKPPAYPHSPTEAPAPGWVWKGRPGSLPGSKEGNWVNPNTGESLRPDVEHPEPFGPHWDWRAPGGQWYRLFPDGSIQMK